MPNTGGRRYALPYPDPTDPVADGAAAIQGLAEAQNLANGQILEADVSVSAGIGTTVIPYGLDYGYAPTVFVTHIHNGSSVPGDATGAEVADARVHIVWTDQVQIVVHDSSVAAPWIMRVRVLVLP